MKIKQIALIGAMVTGIASTSANAAPQQLPPATLPVPNSLKYR